MRTESEILLKVVFFLLLMDSMEFSANQKADTLNCMKTITKELLCPYLKIKLDQIEITLFTFKSVYPSVSLYVSLQLFITFIAPDILLVCGTEGGKAVLCIINFETIFPLHSGNCVD